MTELFVLAVVTVFGAYCAASMRASLRTDREAAVALRAFAQRRGLREEPAPGPPHVREITWEVLRRAFAASPAEASAHTGTERVSGELGGLPLTLDTVRVRRRFVDVQEPWTRMAVGVPTLPRGLRVRPRTRWDRVMEALRRAPFRSGDPAFDRVFTARGEGRDWLGAERRALLLDASRQLGRVEIAEGRLCLLRRDRLSADAELDRLASALAEAARALGAAGAGPRGPRRPDARP